MHRVPLLAGDLGQRLDRLGDARVVEVDVEPVVRRATSASTSRALGHVGARRRARRGPRRSRARRRGRGRRRSRARPRRANRRTVARPMPDPAPVTTATFPSKRPMPGSVARMRTARVIHCVDAHAEGEPSRIIVGGVLDVPGHDDAREGAAGWSARATGCGGCACSSRAARRRCPRDLVLPSSHPEADAGFIIMESSSYEGMSGTNTINTAAVLLETGMVPMVEPVTRMVLEAPAGLVRVRAECSGGRVERHHVRERAVVLHRARRRRRGPGRRDAARRCRLRRRVVRVRRRRRAGLRDRARRGARAGRAGRADPPARRPSSSRSCIRWSPTLSYLSFVVFVAPPRVGGDARHATIVSPGRLDRSPTGTATSARIAVLDRARARWADTYVAESVIDTRFTGRVVGRTKVGASDAVVPAITGRAWITGLPPARRSTRPTRSATASSCRTPGAPAASRARSTPERRRRSPRR